MQVIGCQGQPPTLLSCSSSFLPVQLAQRPRLKPLQSLGFCVDQAGAEKGQQPAQLAQLKLKDVVVFICNRWPTAWSQKTSTAPDKVALCSLMDYSNPILPSCSGFPHDVCLSNIRWRAVASHTTGIYHRSKLLDCQPYVTGFDLRDACPLLGACRSWQTPTVSSAANIGSGSLELWLLGRHGALPEVGLFLHLLS